jgi:hypothetical protein
MINGISTREGDRMGGDFLLFNVSGQKEMDMVMTRASMLRAKELHEKLEISLDLNADLVA